MNKERINKFYNSLACSMAMQMTYVPILTLLHQVHAYGFGKTLIFTIFTAITFVRCYRFGSSPSSSTLFAFLYRCKETQKVHQRFRAGGAAENKKTGSEATDRLLRSPISLNFVRFLPKMQEKTSLALVDKR